MNYIIHSIVTLAMLCLTQQASSEPTKFFRGCDAIGSRFEDNLIVLNPDSSISRQTVYFIHNKSHYPLNIVLMKDIKQPYLSYKNQIGSQQWGVFATDERSLNFACQVAGKNSMVDRQQVIELCQYVDIKFPQGNNGNYWAVTSSPLITARKEIVKQGILLRW